MERIAPQVNINAPEWSLGTGKTSQWVRNPALDPTGTWIDGGHVRFDIHAMVTHSTPEQCEFLARLSDGGPHTVDGGASAFAEWFNQHAGAFGRVPLIDRVGDTCTLAPGASEPVSAVLSPDFDPRTDIFRTAGPLGDVEVRRRHGFRIDPLAP